jgi:UDP-galactopyranose mutase
MSKSYCTWITHEYPTDYIVKKTEPYYPVNDDLNNQIYEKYKILTNSEKKIIFGGRLAEYKYYDMTDVIESAFKLIKKELKNE